MAEKKQEETKQTPEKQVTSAKSEITATKSKPSTVNENSAESKQSKASTSVATKTRKPRIVSATKVENATDGKVTIKKGAKLAEHITEEPDGDVIVVKADHEEAKASKQLANTLRNAYGQIQARKNKSAKEKAEQEASEAAARAQNAEEKLKVAEQERLKAEAASKEAKEKANKAEVENTAEKPVEEVLVEKAQELIEEEKEEKKGKNKSPKNFAELMSVLSDFDDEDDVSNEADKQEDPVKEENSKNQFAGYALADDYKQSLEEEKANADISDNVQEQAIEEQKIEEKPKAVKRAKNTKKDGEYKPPFYQTFKFWVVVIVALCFVALVTLIIINSVNNARSRYPKGFIFEVKQAGGAVRPSGDDIYVYNTVTQENPIRIEIKFDGNFSGNIHVSIGQSGIASIDKDIISGGEIITVTPKYYDNTGDIKEAIGGLTYIEARYGTVYSRMNILFDKQLSNITVTAKMSEEDEAALSGYEYKYYVSRELTLNAETYYGQLSPGFKGDAFARTIYWTSSNPNIASVDKEGRITSKKAGNVTFTARAKEYYNNAETDIPVTRSINITFSDIPVESIMLNNNYYDNFMLWLSDPDALTIDLKECINIATNASLAPLNFSADYLYDNAVLDYFITNNNDKIEEVELPKNLGAGVFELFDAETTHENGKLYLNVKFGDDPQYWLNTYDTNHPITVKINRSKNFVVKLSDKASSSANIEYISFDIAETESETVLYTNKPLLNLFSLQISEAVNGQYEEEKTVNNFIASRDIAFAAVDKYNNNYYELQYNEENGNWYFKPLKACFTNAIVDGEGFTIIAYLKDINTLDANTVDGYAKIDGTELEWLTIKVVAPGENSVEISGQYEISRAVYDGNSNSVLNLYETFRKTIAENKIVSDITAPNGYSKIEISGDINATDNIKYSNLLSENNHKTQNHIYLRLVTSRNDAAITAGNETVGDNEESYTKVWINEGAYVGSVHYLTLEFVYVYDIPKDEIRTNGATEAVVKTVQISIRVVA